MRILLDTHIALWAVTAHASLSSQAKKIILEADEVFVSVASTWEIAIKHSIGKGDMPVSAAQALQAFTDAGYVMLDIKPQHTLKVEALPPIHKDPFDRMLVAQALCEPLVLLTRDPQVVQYGAGILQVV
jgi:PIN domain nuclease of toxin-antitoxin system